MDFEIIFAREGWPMAGRAGSQRGINLYMTCVWVCVFFLCVLFFLFFFKNIRNFDIQESRQQLGL